MASKLRKLRLDQTLAAMIASVPTPPHLIVLARSLSAELRRS